MSKKVISYKAQYYLALIPYIGLFIAWITSWVNIQRKTNNKKYIFLHFVIWIFPMCLAGGLVTVSVLTFMVNLSQLLYKICGLTVIYVASLIMSISCVGISKGIIDNYDSEIIK